MRMPKESRPFEKYKKRINKLIKKDKILNLLDVYIMKIDDIIDECSGKFLDAFFDDLKALIEKYED